MSKPGLLFVTVGIWNDLSHSKIKTNIVKSRTQFGNYFLNFYQKFFFEPCFCRNLVSILLHWKRLDESFSKQNTRWSKLDKYCEIPDSIWKLFLQFSIIRLPSIHVHVEIRSLSSPLKRLDESHQNIKSPLDILSFTLLQEYDTYVPGSMSSTYNHSKKDI